MKLVYKVTLKAPDLRNEDKKEFLLEEIKQGILDGDGVEPTYYWDNPDNDKDEEEISVSVEDVELLEEG